MKKIIGLILFLVFLYGVYIGIECYRVNSSHDLVQPLAVLEANSTSEEMYFKGLGFTVTYKIDREKKTDDLEIITTKEAKFVMFDTFTLFTKYYSKE